MMTISGLWWFNGYAWLGVQWHRLGLLPAYKDACKPSFIDCDRFIIVQALKQIQRSMGMKETEDTAKISPEFWVGIFSQGAF